MLVRSPAGPIQRAFTGLLGLLDLKGSELAPNAMAGFCQPTIDIARYIRAGVTKTTQFSGTLTALSATASYQGSTVPFVVPDGRAWLIRDITATINLLNPDTLESFGISILTSATAGFGPISLESVKGDWAPAVASLPLASFIPTEPYILTAGNLIGISYGGNAVAANRLFSLCASYVDVPL